MEQEKTFPPHREPLRDARLLPTHAPAQIIGRNRELAALNTHLKQGGSALLTGTAGIGKTALAAVLATAYSQTQSGGVLWLDVVEDDAPYLIARLGRAYGVDTYAVRADGRGAVADRLRRLLAAKPPLIVLDGTLDLAAVSEMLARCAPNIPTLLTNAARGSGAWQTFSLEPLSLNDSQTVFRLYAGIRDPNTHKADVEALCRRLDGAPLTLELAGRLAAANNLTPSDLLKDLSHTTSRESQQAVLMLAFKHLSAPLQGLLLVLATTFTGSATVPLLSAASRVPPPQVINLMRTLVMRGLVREAVAYSQPLFSVHEAVQRYALAYLRNNKRLEALEGRALIAAVNYATASSERAHLAVEIDNLLGAAAYAASQADAESLSTLQKALAPLAEVGFRPELDMLRQLSGQLNGTQPPEGETQVQEAVVSETQRDGFTTQPRLEEPAIEETGATPVIQPLWASVQAAKATTQPNAATAPQPTSLPEVPPTEPSLPTAAKAAPIIIDEDDLDESDTLPLLPVQLSAPTTSESVRGRALLAEADAQPTFEGKLERLSRATELLRADEDWIGAGQALEKLGALYLANGKAGESVMMFEQAAAIFHRYDQLAAERGALAQIGRAYTAQQQPQRAAEYYNRALFLAHEGQDRGAEATAFIQLAETHYLLKDYAAAALCYRKALHLAYADEDQALLARLTLALGMLLLEDVRTLNQAVQLLEEATTYAPDNPEPKRLLKRANERVRRWQTAKLPLAAASSNREFAAAAYE